MKKKLLTLTFTLVLLIGLVAAMGVNASAEAPQAFKVLANVSTYDQLDSAIQQAAPGWTIVLNNDIEVTNDANQKLTELSVQGTLVIDLNGHDIEINSRFTNGIFQVGGYWSTDLHIVNSKYESDPASIVLNSTQSGASVISINDANSSLHLYKGVNIVTSTDGNYFAVSSPSDGPVYGISAMNFNTIGIHGADITIRSAYGSGIKIYSGTADTFANSKLIVDGGANIKAKVAAINLQGSISIPKMEIKSCYLDYETSAPTNPPSYSAKSNYKAINTSSATLKFSDIAPEGVSVKRSVVGYDVAKDTVVSSIGASNSLRFGYITSCTHPVDKKTGLVYFLTSDREEYTHYAVCSACSYNVEITGCTYVYAEAATAEKHGHTNGYDCSCGYKTSTDLHYYTEYAKAEPTCTTSGNKETMYVCRICTTYYDSNKNQIHGKVFLQNKISALGHDMKAVSAVAATCTKAGNIAHYDCSRCDYKSSDAEGKNAITNVVVAKKAHSYKTVTTKATLTKNGKSESKCSCGAVKSGSAKTIYYPKTIKLEYTSATYNGKTKTPSVSVKDYKGNKLKKDTDYTVKYASGRKSTGKYSVTITFKGKYSGTKTLYFNILPSKTSKITPTCSTTEIKASWKKVTGASGYKVEILNSKGKVVKKVTTTKTSYTFKKLSKVTTYKIRVTAYKTIDKKAAYSTVSTTITTSTAPAKVSLSKVTAGSKSATPAWKTVSGASGYQVQYSTSSKFKSAKSATVSKVSSKKTTIKKLTKGKKYYFKVRAYKTVGSVKVYGAWSAVKSVKVK